MAKNMQQVLDERRTCSKAALTDGLPDDPVNKALDRELDAQFNIATHAEDIVLIDTGRLHPYSKHPFKAYNDERLNALADSIARDGLQQPIIVRAIEGKSSWEILSGHNRVEAMKRLGRRDISAIVRELTDDQAALVVVETNLRQRDKLLPSEKAFAYKLQMEALQGENTIINNGDLRSSSNSFEVVVQFESDARTRDKAAEKQRVSCSEIQRYIRLTYLLPELLDLLDHDKIPVMAGYEISFLDAEAQHEVYHYFFESGAKDKLSLKNAETVRTAYQSVQPINADSITGILHKPVKKPGPVTYRFSQKELKRQYALPNGFDLTAYLYEKLA